MHIAISIISLLVGYLGMEGVAWLAHKYLMHGFLWFLHADHHQKTPGQVLERNDWFFVLFALPGVLLTVSGSMAGFDFRFFLGLGIALYGLTYFLVHEVFIHQRLPFFRRTDSVFWAAVRRAHRTHHIHKQKEDGECFGMLWVPQRFFEQERERLRQVD